MKVISESRKVKDIRFVSLIRSSLYSSLRLRDSKDISIYVLQHSDCKTFSSFYLLYFYNRKRKKKRKKVVELTDIFKTHLKPTAQLKSIFNLLLTNSFKLIDRISQLGNIFFVGFSRTSESVICTIFFFSQPTSSSPYTSKLHLAQTSILFVDAPELVHASLSGTPSFTTA